MIIIAKLSKLQILSKYFITSYQSRK